MAKSTPTPTSTTTAQRRSVDSGKVEKYGYLVDRSTPMLKLELCAYADKIGPDRGGLGQEEHFKRAFRLTWPEYQWSDWVELLIWAWCNYKYISVIGHQRASKTYTFAHIVYLDYLARPDQTVTSIGTVTFQGLKLRMWGDIMQAVNSAAVPCPFQVRSTTNEMQICISDKERKDLERYQIHGLAINGNQNAEGRIRGAHAPRRRFIGDEAQDIDPVIYDAMTNIASAPDAKIGLLTNPKNKVSPFGNFCEPVNGHSSVSETDLFWETKKGGVCLHFDGLQSPNVKAGKSIFTGLLTTEIVEDVRRVDGENSVAWWSRIRGWWAPDGMVSRIFNEGTIIKGRNRIEFDYAPEVVASLDPAYENDKAPLHFGDMGKLSGRGLAINCTETVVMNYKIGPGEEPKDYQLAHWVMVECKKRGVKPEHFIMDKTGGGRGTFAILQVEWSPDVQGIEYGGAATDRLIRENETTKASELYKKFVTELWFRAANCIKDGLIGGVGNLHPETETDLNAREYELKQFSEGERIVAETKTEMKKRLGRSPDHGDAFCGFGELLCRLGQKPGNNSPAATAQSQKWGQARDRARKACKVYANETYSH